MGLLWTKGHMEQRGVTPVEAIPGRPTPSPPGIPYMGIYPLSTHMSCAAYGENNNVDRKPHFVGSIRGGRLCSELRYIFVLIPPSNKRPVWNSFGRRPAASLSGVTLG